MRKANPHTSGRRAVAAMLAALAVIDAYDVFVPSYVIDDVQGPWGLSPAQFGMLVSAGLLGFMIGSFATSFVADWFGRRPTFPSSLMVAGLCSLSTALLAHELYSFVFWRVGSGIGLAMVIPIVATYLNEIMAGRSSKVGTVAASSGYTLGGAVAGIAGIVLTPPLGWPSLFHIGGLGCVVSMVLNRLLPESPMFRGQDRRSGVGLLSRERSRDGLVLWAGVGLALLNVYALSTWLPSLMIARGSGFCVGFLSGSLLQLAGLAGGLACAVLADHLGSRRGPLTLWFALTALSLAGFGVTTLPIVKLIFAAAAGSFLIGEQPVFNNLAAQAYPTHLRATGVGMMLGIGRIGAVAGPVVIGAVRGVTSGDAALFAVMAGAAGVTALVLLASSDRAIERLRQDAAPNPYRHRARRTFSPVAPFHNASCDRCCRTQERGYREALPFR